MSENGNHDKHEKIASRFGRTTDPLGDYDDAFWEMESAEGISPIEMFLEERVYSNDYAHDTVRTYERRLEEWSTFMRSNYDRHPACPASRHAIDYATHLLEDRANAPKTVERKLEFLSRFLHYLAEEASFPPPKTTIPSKRLSGR